MLGEDAHILRPLLQPDAPTLTPRRPDGPRSASARARRSVRRGVEAARVASRSGAVCCSRSRTSTAPTSRRSSCSPISSPPPRRRPPACGCRVVIVATAPVRRAPASASRGCCSASSAPAFSAISLGGLGMGGTRRLVGSLGLSRPSEPTLRAIQQATDGNPLFIREMVREADRSGTLHVPDAGVMQAIGPTSPTACARRSRRGSTASTRTARASLEAAAFIGERFGALAVSAVCGADAETTRAHLQAAVRAELLVAENRSFRFEHPLIRETLCEDTSEADRREIHRDVAAVLEELYATAPGEHALEIASHLIEAGSARRAGAARPVRTTRGRPGVLGFRLARGRALLLLRARRGSDAPGGGTRAAPSARRLRRQPRVPRRPLPASLRAGGGRVRGGRR